MDWCKRFERFDPQNARPFDCWALVELEKENYVRINRGEVEVTEKGRRVSPAHILRHRPPRWHCIIRRQMLIMEKSGFLTIRDGTVSLTENGLTRFRTVLGIQLALALQDTGEFDPEELSADACWGLLCLEERGYLAIRRGFVIDGDNEDAVPSADELQDLPSLTDFGFSKFVLILESRGLVTVRRGEIALSDRGAEEYASVNVDCGSGEVAGKTVQMQVSERIHSFLQRCTMPGESMNCVLGRLRAMVEGGRTEADGIEQS